ncbi:VPLPA-CTERM protein sorting domain-containing protein [Jannaschia seohaensis]|uniref:Putative secreted protein n=2 Tax=Jannaschia seohaensis TaxID=475081 RepID=A0A2Y9AYQ4_9RHOB|nr:putative secreted protein [Jannaschia seohaensis]SSA49311.1 VPLPA-CTERM protein sorting domain-containing protein [Jannaschia seohaensis]
MRAFLPIAALAVSLAGPAASAVVINIGGVEGGGSTTLTFSGSTQTQGNGSVRATGALGWSETDAFQPFRSDSIPFLSDTTIQDVIYTLTGTPTLTIGAETRTLTQLFLDSDAGTLSGSDDLGLRVGSELVYSSGQTVTFSGSGTIALDITSFNYGTYTNGGSSLNRIGVLAPEDDVTFIVAPTPVPTPAALPLLLAALGGLALFRRRT